MNARRVTMLAAALAVAATVQMPVAAQAEPWTLFDWLRPVPHSTVEWSQPLVTPTAVAPAPRRQRVATVIAPEPVRRPPVRMLIVGIGF
jgi:hypothetical protein